MAYSSKVWRLYLSEFLGTALLLMAGLSVVIFIWGAGTALGPLIPSVALRKLLTGFLFGCTGCGVALSRVGKISGAHINPAVSIAFWMRGKMKFSIMMGYILSQLSGAIVGCIPLLLWGQQGRSIGYGNTIPQPEKYMGAFLGEMITTMLLITVIFIFVGSKKLRRYTPFTMPFLYSFMVWAETSWSGCSTNPARSFGPAVISGVYNGYWIYWAAPVSGVVLTVAIFKLFRLHEYYKISAARLSYHHHSFPVNITPA